MTSDTSQPLFGQVPSIVDHIVDHIVVGGGVAGCVLAARLSENPDRVVLLLETGSDPYDSPADLSESIATPGLAPALWSDERVVHADLTVPQGALGDRQVPLATGKGLGGGSTVNAMAWHQGIPADYDGWEAHGASGWGWDSIRPLLQRIEDHESGSSTFHGTDGPISVSTPRHLHATALAFVEAAVQSGVGLSEDLNGERREGVGIMPLSMRNGARHSAFDAYLRPVSDRSNLHILTRQRVGRVLIEDGRAVGVITDDNEGTWRARRGVVLCAGTIRTPQLLMLSGIGPAEHLSAHGIDVIVDRPSVGENLHDHPVVSIVWPLSESAAERGGVYDHALEAFRLLRRGPLTTLGQTIALTRSSDELDGPDIHLIFAPIGADAGGDAMPMAMAACHLALLAPTSRGTVRLASSDASDAPLIDPQYLHAPEDRSRLHGGLRRMQELFDQDALASQTGDRLAPPRDANDAVIDAYIDENLATYWHPVGTARMGDDDDAVVDSTLAVRGVEGLWVADASVIPRIPHGALQAPTTVIAERAADLLRAD